MNPARKAKHIGNNAVKATRDSVNTPMVQGLARFGYIAQGVIYALIGLLAAQLAFLDGGQLCARWMTMLPNDR